MSKKYSKDVFKILTTVHLRLQMFRNILWSINL